MADTTIEKNVWFVFDVHPVVVMLNVTLYNPVSTVVRYSTNVPGSTT